MSSDVIATMLPCRATWGPRNDAGAVCGVSVFVVVFSEPTRYQILFHQKAEAYDVLQELCAQQEEEDNHVLMIKDDLSHTLSQDSKA